MGHIWVIFAPKSGKIIRWTAFYFDNDLIKKVDSKVYSHFQKVKSGSVPRTVESFKALQHTVPVDTLELTVCSYRFWWGFSQIFVGTIIYTQGGHFGQWAGLIYWGNVTQLTCYLQRLPAFEILFVGMPTRAVQSIVTLHTVYHCTHFWKVNESNNPFLAYIFTKLQQQKKQNKKL